MTTLNLLIMILVVTAVTVFTRAVPFLFFAGKDRPPAYVLYLGKILPPAVMAMLVVFSVRNTDILAFPYGIPAFSSLAIVILLHIWKRNTLLSILSGTALYMILVQFIFKI
jgi:branched-subunit amino acid transport protein AzlD